MACNEPRFLAITDVVSRLSSLSVSLPSSRSVSSTRSLSCLAFFAVVVDLVEDAEFALGLTRPEDAKNFSLEVGVVTS